MDVVVELGPEEALVRAEGSGVLVIPHEANFAEEEWWPVIDQWRDACHVAGRASVALLIDRNPGRASVHFDGKGLPCFAEEGLDAAMGCVLEDVVDGYGFGDGAFASWTTAVVPLAKAGRVAARAMRLDHFARDPLEAVAFEEGGKLEMVQRIHAL